MFNKPNGAGKGDEPRPMTISKEDVSYTHLRAHENVLELLCHPWLK